MPTRTAVPFLDLSPSHDPLREDLLEAIEALIESNAFTNGPAVAEFEAEFASYCGADFCVGVASGLDALRLALLAERIAPGDEVIVPANTFVATLEAVTQAGGNPVVVDVTEDDYNIDPEAVDAALSERTRFVLPVHLYGQLADMRELQSRAQKWGTPLIEDACQAHGATRDGIRAGAGGAAAAFSFYPAKNLGAFGDAGALVSSDEKLAERVRALREHGQRVKYRHDHEGYTARLDTIQALVLSKKLPRLDAWNEERRAVARFYNAHLDGIGDLRLPPVPEGSEPVWHLYEVRTAHPERLSDFLRRRNIGSGRHYPQAVHLSPAYQSLGYRRGQFPVAEALAEELLSLPIFPGMTDEQLEALVEAVTDYFRLGV